MLTVIGCLMLVWSASEDGILLDEVQVTLLEEVEIVAPLEGTIAAVEVREGDSVRKGASLGRLDDVEAQLQKRRAEIELENATKLAGNDVSVRFTEKSRELAEAELQRARDSLKRYPKSISQSEIERLELDAEKAALAVEQSTFEFETAQFAKQLGEADLELADYNVQRRQFTAPIAGIVVEVNRTVGEWVKSSEPVFRIVRVDRLRVEGFVNANQVSSDLVGQPVELRTTVPGSDREEVFPGKMIFVSPEISPVNAQVRVWAEIENSDLRLRPGMRGTLVIHKTATRETHSE